MTYFIKTFGCASNTADSERIAGSFSNRGYKPAKNINNADVVIINTCVVRESAENRVYGLLEKLKN
ncbi:MAG: tRNA (N6-isopentenyl adenosine(37)-C2)-methylthiotransferase MiaB, partial [bacterium]|nr:tRNA (N6-isopentenyl adenosine(37)-C2)-methylthiotransferase MiaB [bacterium]